MANIPLIGPQAQIDPLTGLPIDPRARMLLAQQVFNQPGVQEAAANQVPSRQRLLQQQTAGREAVAAGPPLIGSGPGPGSIRDYRRAQDEYRVDAANKNVTGAERGINEVFAAPGRFIRDSIQGVGDYFGTTEAEMEARGKPAAAQGDYSPAGFFAPPAAAATVSPGGGGSGRSSPWYDPRQSSSTDTSSPYNTVVGFGRFGQPPKPLTQMTMGEVVAFGRNVLIPNSRAAGVGRDSRGTIGSSASGAYQITQETMRNIAPGLFGDKWRSMPYSEQNQDAMGRLLFEQNKSGNLKQIWQGLPDSTPGAYANMTWDQMKPIIHQYESGGQGGGGGPGAGVGVDPYAGSPASAFDNSILADYDAARAAGKIPTSTEVTNPFMEPPKPGDVPGRDFTASDAALERLRPAEVLEQDKTKMIRQGIFQGMAQALMSTPDGAGLGKVLAMFGAGTLAGNVQGNKDVEEKMEKYDRLMAEFNTAVFNNERDKSGAVWQQAVAQSNQDNQYAKDRFTEFTKHNNMTVTPDGQVIITTAQPNGKIKIETRALDALWDQATAMGRIPIMQGIAQHMVGGQAVEAGVRNHIATRAAEIEQSQTGSGISQMIPGMMIIQQAVASKWAEEYLGEQGMKDLNEEWMHKNPGIDIGSEAGQQSRDKFLENKLLTMIMNPQFKGLWEAMQQAAPLNAASEQTRGIRQGDRRTNTRSGATTFTQEGAEF